MHRLLDGHPMHRAALIFACGILTGPLGARAATNNVSTASGPAPGGTQTSASPAEGRAATNAVETPAIPPATHPPPAPPPVRRPPARRPPVPRYLPERRRSQSENWGTSVVDFFRESRETMGGRIHVGVRSTTFEFDQSHSRIGQGEENYFVGSIDELQDIQDDSLSHLTFGLYLTRNFGVEYREEEVRARTFTDSIDNHSDGDFVVEGSIISLIARLPLDQLLYGAHRLFQWPVYDTGPAYDFLSRFVPYIGVSMNRMEGSFDVATWWANGYSSPARWQELGSPPTEIFNNHIRELRVTDDIGQYRLYGISVRVIDYLYVDFHWAAVEAELAVDFYLDGQLRDTGVIPMDYESTSVGIRYFF